MTSEEDGTRSGVTKINTKQGSDNKKNVKKTVFQQRHSQQPEPTSPEDLTGATLSALRSVTFKNTIKRLLGYATLKYGHYTGQAVRTRQSKTFSRLSKPSNGDISDSPDSAKYWWKAECKETMAEIRTYNSNLRKMFPTVLGCCDKYLQGKVQNRSDFDYLEYSSNTLGLVNTIK